MNVNRPIMPDPIAAADDNDYDDDDNNRETHKHMTCALDHNVRTQFREALGIVADRLP